VSLLHGKLRQFSTAPQRMLGRAKMAEEADAGCR
jgi:hypothetical protein